MNSKQINILKEGGLYDWDHYFYYDYENELGFEYDYWDSYISYERLENGLVDWSDEIPISVKRQSKIDEILNNNLTDNTNNLGKFWPKK
jgi:hypothetical protein